MCEKTTNRPSLLLFGRARSNRRRHVLVVHPGQKDDVRLEAVRIVFRLAGKFGSSDAVRGSLPNEDAEKKGGRDVIHIPHTLKGSHRRRKYYFAAAIKMTDKRTEHNTQQ